MRIIKNINSATGCALYNKGVNMLRAALDSLTKIIGKKMDNYLVVPNNCILSLSLSSRAGLNNTFFLHSYARAKRAVIPVNKGLLGASFVRFFVPFCLFGKRQIRTNL